MRSMPFAPAIWTLIFALAVGFSPNHANSEIPKENTGQPGEEVPPPGDAVAMLQKPVATVDWDEVPFEDVLEWLRDKAEDRVNIIPRWRALANAGVEAETLVSLKLTNTTVAQVLSEVMEQLTTDSKVTFQATENFIRISSQEDFDRKLVRAVYDIGDILFKVPDFTQEAPQIDLSGQNQQGGGGGGAGGGGQGGQSIFSQGGGGQQGQQQGLSEQDLETARTQLRDLILRTVAPESWADVPGTVSQSDTGGGGRGRLQIYNRSMVVLNTIEVHEELAGWFALSR